MGADQEVGSPNGGAPRPPLHPETRERVPIVQWLTSAPPRRWSVIRPEPPQRRVAGILPRRSPSWDPPRQNAPVSYSQPPSPRLGCSGHRGKQFGATAAIGPHREWRPAHAAASPQAGRSGLQPGNKPRLGKQGKQGYTLRDHGNGEARKAPSAASATRLRLAHPRALHPAATPVGSAPTAPGSPPSPHWPAVESHDRRLSRTQTCRAHRQGSAFGRMHARRCGAHSPSHGNMEAARPPSAVGGTTRPRAVSLLAHTVGVA